MRIRKVLQRSASVATPLFSCFFLAAAAIALAAENDGAWALSSPPAALERNDGPITRGNGVVGGGPTIPGQDPSGALVVDPSTRAASRTFYLSRYVGTGTPAMGWTGSLNGKPGEHPSGKPGATSSAFQDATRQRVNWFRAMAGVPGNVAFDKSCSAKCQQAALIMAGNSTLTHTPSNDLDFYTADGAVAAKKSNIALGWNGPEAVTAYMLDYGSGNTAIGHRRWLLYPQTRTMGSGDIPWMDNFYAANALWVIDSNLDAERPSTRDGFVAWPPPGFVPSPVVFPRWSFSYPDADFSRASVTMSRDGQSVPVALEPVDNPAYGENTLVWVWKGIDASTVHAPEPPPLQDEPYLVQVSNVQIAGKVRNFTYTVVVFNPATNSANYQPDLSLGEPGQRSWYGKGSYEAAPSGSLDLTTSSPPAVAKKWRKLNVKLRNDGNRVDTFTLQASAASAGYQIRYLVAGRNVTAPILAGTYEARLRPGTTRTISIRVSLSDPASGQAGTPQSVLIKAISTHDPSKCDAVEATVALP